MPFGQPALDTITTQVNQTVQRQNLVILTKHWNYKKAESAQPVGGMKYNRKRLQNGNQVEVAN